MSNRSNGKQEHMKGVRNLDLKSPQDNNKTRLASRHRVRAVIEQ